MRLSTIPIAKQGGIYKRLETDAEYRTRLCAAGKLAGHEAFAGGVYLDQLGDARGMQRRIVESEI